MRTPTPSLLFALARTLVVHPGESIQGAVDEPIGLEGLLVPDPDPSDNCFARNRFGRDFPAGVTSALPCP